MQNLEDSETEKISVNAMEHPVKVEDFGQKHHLLLDGVEAEVELDEVCEDGVEVGVQLEEHDLAEVRVVDVGEDVKEEAVDLPDVRVERGRELLALHGGRKTFIRLFNGTRDGDIFKIAQDIIVIVGGSAPSGFPHLKNSYRAETMH